MSGRDVKNVAVLMGGWSAEREVSLISGAAVSKGLQEAGYRVTPIDVQRDAGALLTRLYPRPDVVFNALHGRFGEDGCIQGMLNILDIPYTHSGLLASALAMDKPMAKDMFRAAGINVAPGKVVSHEQVLAGDVMARPYVIKPLNEGSSVGVHMVREGDNEVPFGDTGWPFGETVLVEQYVPGKELTVAVMGDRPLGVTEIITGSGFYDYDAKYEPGGSQHALPAKIGRGLYEEVLHLAALAHASLGCRGVSRADFRADGEKLVILEINTQPGMTPTSLVPEQAQSVGISFPELVSWMVEQAECDT